MSGSIIIGLTGLAGAGKDTVADALVAHAGFRKLAFADELRLEVLHAFERADAALLANRATKESPTDRLALGWCTNLEFVHAVQAHLYGGAMPLEALDEPRSPRQIMQLWGTEYRRAQNADYWVIKLLERMIDLSRQQHRRLVVTDCRFANEAAAIRGAGGEIWQVFRPGLRPVENGHASQSAGDGLKPERFVVNSGAITDTIHQVLRQLVKVHGGAVLPIHIEGVTR